MHLEVLICDFTGVFLETTLWKKSKLISILLLIIRALLISIFAVVIKTILKAKVP